jgi:hypothetical protein
MDPRIEGVKERVKKSLNLASPQTLKLQKRRLEICNTCDDLIRKPVKVCSKCGCFLELKTLVETESCVLDKW